MHEQHARSTYQQHTCTHILHYLEREQSVHGTICFLQKLTLISYDDSINCVTASTLFTIPLRICEDACFDLISCAYKNVITTEVCHLLVESILSGLQLDMIL